MKSPFSSWTMIFNFLLIALGVFHSGLSDEIRQLLITNGIVGVGLRAKTKDKLRW